MKTSGCNVKTGYTTAPANYDHSFTQTEESFELFDPVINRNLSWRKVKIGETVMSQTSDAVINSQISRYKDGYHAFREDDPRPEMAASIARMKRWEDLNKSINEARANHNLQYFKDLLASEKFQDQTFCDGEEDRIKNIMTETIRDIQKYNRIKNEKILQPYKDKYLGKYVTWYLGHPPSLKEVERGEVPGVTLGNFNENMIGRYSQRYSQILNVSMKVDPDTNEAIYIEVSFYSEWNRLMEDSLCATIKIETGELTWSSYVHAPKIIEGPEEINYQIIKDLVDNHKLEYIQFLKFEGETYFREQLPRNYYNTTDHKYLDSQCKKLRKNSKILKVISTKTWNNFLVWNNEPQVPNYAQGNLI